jgi:hypothetical protein
MFILWELGGCSGVRGPMDQSRLMDRNREGGEVGGFVSVSVSVSVSVYI